ncbi:MAG: glycosyltransferase family 39 protein, partial [Candidatus Omnitrophica bacterium]|nr:glycosyltransferase family 39 protein [Candidatus Omnitrophota bacterium]
LFHWAFGILTGATIFSFGRRLFGVQTGLVGMVIFYIFSQITILSTQALIDMGLAFYSFLALMAIIEWIGTEDKKWFLLSGISMGLAVGCKYPALLSFIAIEVLILRMSLRGRSPWQSNLIKRLRYAVLFAFIVLLTSSPWFIKNFIWTRNPVYPLFYNIFNGKNWDEVKDERFYKAHAPGKKDIVTLVRTLWDMTFKAQFMTPLFLLLIPLGIFLKDMSKPIRYLLIYLALFYLFWFYWTHRIDRFFLPAIPAMALVSGYVYVRLIEAKILEKPLSIILLFSLLFNLYISAFTLSSINPFAYAFGFETRNEFLVRTLPPYPSMKFINENLDEDAVVLLIGEAEIHYIKRKVIYNTVFDTSIIEEVVNTSTSPEEVYEKVKSLGATHILLNYVEVARLNRTYSYMKDFNWKLFYGFENKYLEKLYSLEDKVLVYKVK